MCVCVCVCVCVCGVVCVVWCGVLCVCVCVCGVCVTGLEKYRPTVCRRVSAPFSPEILQGGSVKGLTLNGVVEMTP